MSYNRVYASRISRKCVFARRHIAAELSMLVEEASFILHTTKTKCSVSHMDRRNDKETAVIETAIRGRHSKKLINPGKFRREAMETFSSSWMRTSDTLRTFA